MASTGVNFAEMYRNYVKSVMTLAHDIMHEYNNHLLADDCNFTYEKLWLEDGYYMSPVYDASQFEYNTDEDNLVFTQCVAQLLKTHGLYVHDFNMAYVEDVYGVYCMSIKTVVSFEPPSKQSNSSVY